MRQPGTACLALVVVSLLAGAPRRLQAQPADTAAVPEPGRRVRVMLERGGGPLRSPYREGVLARIGADTIRIVRPRGDTIALARADVRQLEVLVRTGSLRRRLLVGTAVGIVGGGALGVALGGSMGGCGDTPGCTSSVDTSRSFLAGAAIGGAIGLFAAALTGVHRWRVVPGF